MTLKDMAGDESGQWLLLTGFIVAIGMAVLLVFLNQSSMAGHSSSQSIMEFPKNDIRELRQETVTEARSLGMIANKKETTLEGRMKYFNDSFDRYIEEAGSIYAGKGCNTCFDYIPAGNESTLPGGQRIDNITLMMYYNNGDTSYNESCIVYLR